MYNLDISLLRTFLELNKTRQFGRTAENLYLTQSAVSARIKQLEEVLGVSLFQRFRNNLQLTPQGERLIPHAEAMLNLWTLTVQDVSLPESATQLVIGAPQSVWEAQLSNLPIKLINKIDDIHTRAEALDSQTILRRLQEHTLDIGFVFDMPKIDEIVSEKVIDIELKLYSTQVNQSFDAISDTDYVLVDWGQGFSALHARTLPQIRSPKLHAADWTMAVEFLSQTQGCAFLPTSLVEHAQVELYPVKNAPSVLREVYLCYHVSKPKDENWASVCEAIKNAIEDNA